MFHFSVIEVYLLPIYFIYSLSWGGVCHCVLAAVLHFDMILLTDKDEIYNGRAGKPLYLAGGI